MTATPAAFPFHVALAALLAVAGCGARSELGSSANDAGVSPPTATSTPTSTPPSDCIDAGGPPPAPACGPLQLHLAVAAACSIARPDCAPVDAEGFVSVPTCPGCGIDACDDSPFASQRVFAMSRLGAGHVIGWCDSTNLVSFMGNFEAAGYLGKSSAPRVATVGLYPCGELEGIAVPGATYLGETLPAPYDDGALLAADWDVLVACGAHADFGDAFAPAVLSFVRDHGRGLLAVSDYVCDGAAPVAAFDQMNAVTSQAGFVFEAVNLGHGSGELVAECVADYPP